MNPKELVKLYKERHELFEKVADMNDKITAGYESHGLMPLWEGYTGWFWNSTDVPMKLSRPYPSEDEAMQAFVDGSIEWEKVYPK